MTNQEPFIIEFWDYDSKDQGFASVRIAQHNIGIGLSLENNGDIEVFIGIDECKNFIDALQKAINIVEKSHSND